MSGFEVIMRVGPAVLERHVVVHSWACSTSNRFEVGSCAKRVIGAGQDADVDIVITVKLLKRS